MPGKLIGKPILARLMIKPDCLTVADREDPEAGTKPERLVRLQFTSPYTSKPTSAPILKLDSRFQQPSSTSLLSDYIAVIAVYREPRKWRSIRLKQRCEGTCYRTTVKAYKPSNPATPKKYIAVFWCFDGASTSSGAYRDIVSINYPEKPKPLLTFKAIYSSRSGNHWRTVIAYVGPAPLRVVYYWRSNAGNEREIEYIFDTNGVNKKTLKDVKKSKIEKLKALRDLLDSICKNEGC